MCPHTCPGSPLLVLPSLGAQRLLRGQNTVITGSPLLIVCDTRASVRFAISNASSGASTVCFMKPYTDLLKYVIRSFFLLQPLG